MFVNIFVSTEHELLWPDYDDEIFPQILTIPLFGIKEALGRRITALADPSVAPNQFSNRKGKPGHEKVAKELAKRRKVSENIRIVKWKSLDNIRKIRKN
ncbi:hypothetical protein F8M41_002424 [Gigaspora margarita]|uniref:Uncharacterized protein n=1 Tax=Gigaspora margarita TaxID=4874 RepID=A0A8H4A7D0_GIGMA|nr:hypothetical protein F8M41_002424 [Gigaspora margarita]